ncbi:MAG TPA: hypothetical protein VGM62_12230 [Chthoniobacterales bacterium]|jgi:hypothetical protein
MKRVLVLAVAFTSVICVSPVGAKTHEQPAVLSQVKPLPTALDPNFEFRKTELMLMTVDAPQIKQTSRGRSRADTFASQKATTTAQAASIAFERKYRLFGAVTALDQHQRFGNYFDFFWKLKHPADVTVRLEYRQEKFHAHVQAQEVSYNEVHGNHKTEFRVVGDDYADGGRVIAWRCLLVSGGRIVAENKSFLWE